ncbi:hypothetical protein ACGYLO_16440 [Sulfitobacter sp. 1A13353]|uniref:hypothetical protein n=1 Tax=Sulfitobacter sp. 1A13353 TaxID=3368568 RepID=UPI003746D963
MTDMPVKIWAWHFLPEKQDDVIKGGWDDVQDRKEVEYIRADTVNPALLAAEELADAVDEWGARGRTEATAAALNTALGKYRAATEGKA